MEAAFPELAPHGAIQFWSPASVAERAARLLADAGLSRPARILDIGAGIGRFCAIGSRTTSAVFTGVEHREHLVVRGRAILAELSVDRVDLVHGTVADVAWSKFDAFYLFNPFEENLLVPSERLDHTVPLTFQGFLRDVRIVERALDRAPVGTRVATYFGFGGRVPFSYRLAHAETYGGGALRLWVKTHTASSLHKGHIEVLLPMP